MVGHSTPVGINRHFTQPEAHDDVHRHVQASHGRGDCANNEEDPIPMMVKFLKAFTWVDCL